MGPRPSGLAVLAALNRLGAVAVLLRPDGSTRREATLGQVRRIIADPERAARRPARAASTRSCSAVAAAHATSASR